MAFLWNHQMFLQVFSKKVCFCCILGYFAEKKLPQMSQILTDGACLEFYEFCVLWEYSSPTDCTDQHRWLVAWVWQGCHTLLHLCKSVLSVGENRSKKVLWILWEEITARRFCADLWNLWKKITARRFCANLWNLWEKITARRFCANLWNLWEEITVRRFCEFCEFCGRKSQ